MWWTNITTPQVASNGHQMLSISAKFSMDGKQQTSYTKYLRMLEQLRTNQVGLQSDELTSEGFPCLRSFCLSVQTFPEVTERNAGDTPGHNLCLGMIQLTQFDHLFSTKTSKGHFRTGVCIYIIYIIIHYSYVSYHIWRIIDELYHDSIENLQPIELCWQASSTRPVRPSNTAFTVPLASQGLLMNWNTTCAISSDTQADWMKHLRFVVTAF